MYLRYGSYSHAVGECAVSISKQTRVEGGIPYEVVHQWSISGRLIGNTTAEVVAAIANLERAYGFYGRDLALIDETTGQVCHYLPNAPSLRGVYVPQPPSYPDGTGAQLSTFRDYVITVQAEYPAVGAGLLLRAWQETVTLTGGRPIFGWATCTNGPPVRYQSALLTPYRCIQEGTAVGVYGYPAAAPMLFSPALLDGPDPETVRRTGPDLNTGQGYSVSWSYRFASAAPLIAVPTLHRRV